MKDFGILFWIYAFRSIQENLFFFFSKTDWSSGYLLKFEHLCPHLNLNLKIETRFHTHIYILEFLWHKLKKLRLFIFSHQNRILPCQFDGHHHPPTTGVVDTICYRCSQVHHIMTWILTITSETLPRGVLLNT